MAAAMQAIVDAVMGHALLSASLYPGLTSALGRRNVKVNASPPRVVWVPTRGEIGPTVQVGGARVVGGQSGTRDRQVRTREQSFEVHCWGSDLEQAENLVDAVVAASWDLERGHFRAGSLEWTTQEPDGADYAVLGEKVVLTCAFRIPVRTAAGQLTQLDAQIHVGNFVSDLDATEEQVC